MLRTLVTIGIFIVSGTAAEAAPLRVFVSVSPQQTFVERIGTNKVVVQTMVRPGYSPATYEPTPRQISALANADLYLRIGVPFEQAWMTRISAVNPSMRIHDARQGIEVPAVASHGHGSHGTDGHHADHDPHLWTNPLLVKRMAQTIRDALSELDPVNRAHYEHNYESYAAELDALDAEIRSLLDELEDRRFMVFHPAWGHFARAYRLVQIPIERGGKQPGPQTLTEIISQAKRDQVRVIFVQPQFDQKLAQQVARNIGGRVVVIDPLSPDYTNNMRKVAQQVAQADQ